MELVKAFEHTQTAHCENGVAVGLFKHKGFEYMTEPLVFGLGVGLFYIHVPFMKINHGPAISFRTMPGEIFKRGAKALGIKVIRQKFSDTAKAKEALDQQLIKGVPVGCQVGVFHLAYFPKAYRFHFNAHNIIVYGKKDNEYLVSDPVMEGVTTLTAEQLEDVRFARGPLAPKGHLYYPEEVSVISEDNLRQAIKVALHKNAWWMTRVPFSFIGSSGFRYTAKCIRKWPSKIGLKDSRLYLGQIVRMQEEIGTGGGGFRFIYAAFLEKAAQLLQNERLAVFSENMIKSGDMLRDSAVKMAAVYKGRHSEQQYFDEIADGFDAIADLELQTFKEMYKMKF